MKKLYLLSLSMLFSSLFIINTISAEDVKYQDKRKIVKNLVDRAAYLIQTQGPAAIDLIVDKNGKFNTPDTYVFITSGETGADLINPAFQEIEGLSAKDYNNPIARESQMKIVNAVKNKDIAWAEYLWPKPNETKFSKKISYLRKIIINGKTRIVGAGFYPEK